MGQANSQGVRASSPAPALCISACLCVLEVKKKKEMKHLVMGVFMQKHLTKAYISLTRSTLCNIPKPPKLSPARLGWGWEVPDLICLIKSMFVSQTVKFVCMLSAHSNHSVNCVKFMVHWRAM